MSGNKTCKEAIQEHKTRFPEMPDATECDHVKLYGCIPPIKKMDASLSTLKNCEKLALSSNQIEKIQSLAGLDKLKILSLGRNQIKKIEQLDAVANTLEELWISYNDNLEKLTGLQQCKNLKILYANNCAVSDFKEIARLEANPKLEELSLINNPIQKEMTEKGTWRRDVLKICPSLKKLDETWVTEDDRE
eukprot:Rmarinus@m.417